MQLPELLQRSIEDKVLHQSIHKISEASFHLSDKYRHGNSREGFVQTEAERLAYIISRMPATYAAVIKAFKQVKERMPSFSPQSFFDIGSGPGTGLWAADAIFSDVKECFTWEIDDEFNHLSQTLTQEHPILKKTIRRKRNLEKDRDFFSADLVLMSYSIGEIASEYWDSIFKELWSKLHHTLVIVEPGTPAGYDRILKIRDILLNQGANLIAPCPHAMACPLSRPDWCHFYARVERSSLHRKIKNAELNYEDEKFSYLVFSKQSMEQECQSRILRHPQIQKGYVKIVTCDKDRQIKNHTIRKKDKEIYKLVKKLDWGDCI